MRGQIWWKTFLRFHPVLAALVLCGAFSLCAAEAPLEVADASGARIQPFKLGENDSRLATLFIFTTIDCPVANSYAPEISRIVKEYSPKDIRFFLVHVDPSVTAATALQHAKEYRLTLPVLLDPNHELVKYAGATVTPEAVLFDRAGLLLYRGRIDDRYFDYGKSRPDATVHDLRDALAACVNHRSIANSRSKAVGCLIGDLKAATPKAVNEPSKEHKP